MNILGVLRRLVGEARITTDGAREAVIAVSERVNRRVQILRLHWHAAAVQQQIQATHRQLGSRLCAGLAPAGHLLEDAFVQAHDLGTHIRDTAGSIGFLNKELSRIQAAIRTLELEALREDFLRLQQDLLNRNASMRRLMVTSSAPAVGRWTTDLPLATGICLAALFRGSVMLAPSAHVAIRPQDIIILFGPEAGLEESARLFRDSTSRL